MVFLKQLLISGFFNFSELIFRYYNSLKTGTNDFNDLEKVAHGVKLLIFYIYCDRDFLYSVIWKSFEAKIEVVTKRHSDWFWSTAKESTETEPWQIIEGVLAEFEVSGESILFLTAEAHVRHPQETSKENKEYNWLTIDFFVNNQQVTKPDFGVYTIHPFKDWYPLSLTRFAEVKPGKVNIELKIKSNPKIPGKWEINGGVMQIAAIPKSY